MGLGDSSSHEPCGCLIHRLVSTLDDKYLDESGRVRGVPSEDDRDTKHDQELFAINHCHRREHPDVERRPRDGSVPSPDSSEAMKDASR